MEDRDQGNQAISGKQRWTQTAEEKTETRPRMIKVSTQEDGETVSELNLYILPNDDETHDRRPFAVVENVRTKEEHRRRGHATRNLERAEEIARRGNCYKITLTTGSKKESTHRLYQQAGYSGDEKTCYNKRLN